jgi:hypothetical protein
LNGLNSYLYFLALYCLALCVLKPCSKGIGARADPTRDQLALGAGFKHRHGGQLFAFDVF